MKEARQVERGALIVRLPGRATRAHLEFLSLALQAIRSPKAATPPRRISPRRGPFFCRGLSPRHSLGSFGGRAGISLRSQPASKPAQDDPQRLESSSGGLLRHAHDDRSPNVQEVGCFSQERGATDALAS